MTPLEPMNVNREMVTASAFGSRPFTAADCLGCIVAFTIIVAPFNAMVSVPFGGELSTEAYFMIQLAFVPIIVPILIGSYPTSTSRNLLVLAGLILTSIVVSFLANYSNIMGDVFRGRSAFEKMTSSAAVILFGIYCANVVYVAALTNLNRYFVHPLAIAVCVVLIVGAAQLIAIAAPGT